MVVRQEAPVASEKSARQRGMSKTHTIAQHVQVIGRFPRDVRRTGKPRFEVA